MLRQMARSLVIVGCWTSATSATDFLRGDANSDELLTLADAHFVSLALFRGGALAECHKAANANSDAKIDIADSIWIINYLFRNGPTPLEPFPGAGPGPAWETIECAAYGNGAPLEDPGAELAVLDAVAAGGADPVATITLAVSSTQALAGYSATLRVGDPVAGINAVADASGSFREGFLDATLALDGVLRVGFLSTLLPNDEPGSIAPGVAQPVLELTVCLRSGTRAGSYPLTLEDVELVDDATGRMIRPRVLSGTLTVEQDLDNGAGCGYAACDLPETPPDPSQVNAMFRLAEASGFRGDTVAVPWTVRSSQRILGYAFSVDFDEESLRAASIEEVARVGVDGFKRLELNNRNDRPENGGIDEGFFVGAAVLSLSHPCASLPADQDNEVLRFHLEIRPEAGVGTSAIAFIDGARGSGTATRNSVTTAHGVQVTPDIAGSFVLVGAGVDVLPDLTAFVRGDSNGDDKVDISDATATLGFLFLGARPLECHDAADANDDGTVDIADPVATLLYLFQGDAAPPAPFPDEGEDPTADRLTCRART